MFGVLISALIAFSAAVLAFVLATFVGATFFRGEKTTVLAFFSLRPERW